jgi:hypothetical protein
MQRAICSRNSASNLVINENLGGKGELKVMVLTAERMGLEHIIEVRRTFF